MLSSEPGCLSLRHLLLQATLMKRRSRARPRDSESIANSAAAPFSLLMHWCIRSVDGRYGRSACCSN